MRITFIQKKSRAGFTLIETLIAITILMLAIVGPLTLSQAGLFSATQQRNQITAFFLAQEGIEYVKNLRDSNTYQDPQRDWLAGIAEVSTEPCYPGKTCNVDPHATTVNNQIFSCAGTCPYIKLYTSGTDFKYNYQQGSDTIYRRTIQISPVDAASTAAAEEIKIKVTIEWNEKNTARSFSVTENMYNYEQ